MIGNLMLLDQMKYISYICLLTLQFESECEIVKQH